MISLHVIPLLQTQKDYYLLWVDHAYQGLLTSPGLPAAVCTSVRLRKCLCCWMLNPEKQGQCPNISVAPCWCGAVLGNPSETPEGP